MSGGRERDEGTGARRLRERRDRGAHLLPQWRQDRWGPTWGQTPCASVWRVRKTSTALANRATAGLRPQSPGHGSGGAASSEPSPTPCASATRPRRGGPRCGHARRLLRHCGAALALAPRHLDGRFCSTGGSHPDCRPCWRHPQRFLLSGPTCLCLRTPGLRTFHQSVGCLCLRTSCLCLRTPGLRTFCLWALLWVPR